MNAAGGKTVRVETFFGEDKEFPLALQKAQYKALEFLNTLQGGHILSISEECIGRSDNDSNTFIWFINVWWIPEN